MNKQHIAVLSCCHGEPACCESCEESCSHWYANKVRNPEYPRGMTMDELIQGSESIWCHWCGRSPRPQNSKLWIDADHDGMCPVPFMRAALMKIAFLEHEIWQLNRKETKNA